MKLLLVDRKIGPRYPGFIIGNLTNAAPNSIEGPCPVR